MLRRAVLLASSMNRARIRPIVLGMLVFCGVNFAPVAAARAGACTRIRLAQVELRDDGGFLSIPVTVEGQPVRLMLDTGSEAGLITPQSVRMLNVATNRATFIELQGTGGAAKAAGVARLHDLAIGPLVMAALDIPVGALPSEPHLSPPIIGFLGGDILQRFDLEIDLEHARVSFWRIDGASLVCAQAPAWTGRFRTAELTSIGARLAIDAWLDGHRLHGLLDTGARSLLVSVEAAKRAGVDQEVLAGEPGGITAGVDLREQTFHWHRFGALSIGSERIDRPVLTVAPIEGPFDLLIGTAWLEHRDVWISYRQHALFWR